ncbi:hypothetical protein LTR10_003967 [Elasticomyces elasticus]|nr:hypothetical protein LTR10_003967 [Elasticomyces elasticus]
MSDIAWSRLVRYISANDGAEHYGEPIMSSDDQDIGELADAGNLSVRICDGSDALSATPTDREDRVKQLLGPLASDEVPIIRCIGLNYKTHIQETGRPLPECPTVFTKPAPAIADYDERIPIPVIAQSQCDYEGELVILIGKAGKDISEDQALDYVAGYTCGNDVSARDWQRETGKAGAIPQWSFSKSFDKYAPLGPALIAQSILGGADKQELQTIVNGDVRQRGNTVDLCFGVRQLVAFCSQGQTLQKGSLIMTGTPGGVGLFMKPPCFLKHGDEVKHNHGADQSRHICTECGVSYARKDLLTRHLATGHHANSSVARQRCHTACEACRTARKRCDGARPCQQCIADAKVCRSPSNTHRVSKVVRRATGTPSLRDGDSSEYLLQSPNTALSGSANGIQAVDTDETFAPPSLYASLTSPTSMIFPDQDAGFVPEASAPDSILEDGNDVVMQLLDFEPWPWLHENIYLQGDPFAAQTTEDPGLAQNGNGTGTECDVLQDPAAAVQDGLTNHRVREAQEVVAVVDELVSYAAAASSHPEMLGSRSIRWATASSRLAHSAESTHPTEHALRGFTNLYMASFNPLWPLFSIDDFDQDELHPVLYLTLTSIGAMYGCSSDQPYGTLMHERLRRLLTAGLFDLEGPEEDLTWLIQARLLTQVAALYFGQRRAFSYAQHLGAILAAQARRMDLFRVSSPVMPKSTSTPQMQRATWMKTESRRRLAFGLLRADVFNSLLLGNRPLLTPEEFEITLPRSDTLWHNHDHLSLDQLSVAQRFEDQGPSRLVFADLVRIFLDREETPPEIPAVACELSLFGLQGAIWSFSNNSSMFRRMTGKLPKVRDLRWIASARSDIARTSSIENAMEKASANALGASEDFDLLGRTHRRMGDLANDYDRVLHSLEAWRRVIDNARTSASSNISRDTLMSSMLLFHISHLRLCAPLQDLHHVSYRVSEQRAIDQNILHGVCQWRRGEEAEIATSHAHSIWLLIRQEEQRQASTRFNFLAFCGLHHATVVLWTVQGASIESSGNSRHAKQDTTGLLAACADLFNSLNALGGATFGIAARKLAEQPFPQLMVM